MTEFSRTADSDDAVCACPNETENIIVIGSELSYDSFWLKMMFMACGFAVAQGRIPPPGFWPASRTRVVYVPEDYTRHERLPLDYLRDTIPDLDVVAINSTSEFTTVLNDREIDGKRHDIGNLVIFAHGLPSYFALNYPRRNINVSASDFEALPSDLFAARGNLVSYACRTAAPSGGSSLGARIASHFDITVRAYQRRTFYGSVLRDRADTAEEGRIVAGVRAGSGGVIALPPAHEALPHPGLGNGFLGLYGASKEGTRDYALWRTAGARVLPSAGATPEALPSRFETITP